MRRWRRGFATSALLATIVLSAATCAAAGARSAPEEPTSGETADPTPQPWWEHPEDFPDHDYERAASMAIGSCPDGKVVDVWQWEEGAQVIREWEGVAPPELVEASRDDPAAAEPRAVDTLVVEVDDPAAVVAALVEPDPAEVPAYSAVQVLCAEVEPGTRALISTEVFILLEERGLLQAEIASPAPTDGTA